MAIDTRDLGTGHRRFVTTTVEVEGRDDTKVVELPELEPDAWDENAQLTIVGQRVTRVDAPDKVLGRARYTADVARTGMLHAAILRSTIARGKAVLDLTRAREVGGVLDVIDATTLDRRIRLARRPALRRSDGADHGGPRGALRPAKRPAGETDR